MNIVFDIDIKEEVQRTKTQVKERLSREIGSAVEYELRKIIQEATRRIVEGYKDPILQIVEEAAKEFFESKDFNLALKEALNQRLAKQIAGRAKNDLLEKLLLKIESSEASDFTT